MKRDCFKTEMKLSSILIILHLLCVTLKVAQGRVSMAKKDCNETCGKITVPYPFGMGPDRCSAGPNFTAVCDTSTSPPKLILSALKLEARRFFVTQQTVQVVYPVSHMTCSPKEQRMELAKLSIKHPYNFSSIYSRFVVIGCDNIVSMLPSYGACNPYCSPESEARGCNGVHCCQANIPPGLKELSIIYRTVTNTTSDTCGYAFLTDDKWLKDRKNMDFKQMRKPLKEVTLVLQWELDITKMELEQKTIVCSNASRSDNSTVCSCKEGFEGNPFLVEEHGCQDINECNSTKLNTCKVKSNCVNKEGTFICQESIMPKLAYAGAGSGLGALVLLAGAWTSAMAVKKRMDEKDKAYYYKRNGGVLLKEQLGHNDSGGEEFRIFSSEELKEATNHYKSLELGRGGQGIVYKGMLQSDGKIVAVKKEVHEKGKGKEVDEASIKPFINEVLILSQINHKNIVKLLGCCLETKVPILVYEYVPNGTLFDYIHGLHGRKHEFPWESRLTIATQVAEAISELHNAKPNPIYHRDVKSTNILLDEEYQAKVSDFGMPWSVSIDKDNLPTRVRMTVGYADPLYLQSRKYTDKSDVYSFGVVMVELLNRDLAVSDLATHFLESMKENKLLDIVDEEVKNGPKEEIVAFAELARRCLDFDVTVRPTMKVATEELVGIKKPKERSRTQSKHEDTEIESREVSDVSDYPSTSTTPNLNVFTGEP